MIFRQLFDATSCTYTYLIASRRGAEALLIAIYGAERIIAEMSYAQRKHPAQTLHSGAQT